MGELGVVFEGLGWKHSPPPPDPASFSVECLAAAEEAAEQVVNYVHPTLDTEERRRDVIDYVQRLIKSHVDCEVFPYGSVPLKTYLPDGDIDLTVLRAPTAEDTLARDVFAVLQGEEHNKDAEFQVKDTQFIDAEVKLVKCLVRDIIVDISFNQLGGLSTLCFLEQIDRVVGRNHLFKRSIILVKAWCYFESRILGAHHGLISTYALETLVLYIFHMFHSSLNGPVTVLYRFLEYYSHFDWDNYCISLGGPVSKSSLPNIVVKMPERGWTDRMFSEKFLENCMDMFAFPLKRPEETPKVFQAKHLNIIDPLKDNNNLGRSVNRGNFYRIRSAFKYGARKLGQILLQSTDKVADDISDFFSSTLARHGYQPRSNFRCLAPEFGDEELLTASSPTGLLSEDEMLLESSFSDSDKYSVGVEENDLDRFPVRELSPEMVSEVCCSAGGVNISKNFITNEAHDVPKFNSSLKNGTSSYTSSGNYGESLSGNHDQKSQFFSSKSSAESAGLGVGNFSQVVSGNTASRKCVFNSWFGNRNGRAKMDKTHQFCMDNSQPVCTTASGAPTAEVNFVENLSLDFRDMDLSSLGELEPINPLADLAGDYDSHLRSLLHGQLCQRSKVSVPATHKRPPSPSPSGIHYKKPWDIVRQSIPLRQNQYSQMNSHMVSTDQSLYATADSALPAVVYHTEGKQKARGTGTYFPHVNGFYKDKPSRGRGRNMSFGNCNQYNSYGSSNHVYPTSSEANYFENFNHGVVHARGGSQGRVRSDFWRETPRSVGDWNQTNAYVTDRSFKIEFGSVGNLAKEVISGAANNSGSTQGASLVSQGTPAAMKHEKVVAAPVHLMNNDEFPSLCQLHA